MQTKLNGNIIYVTYTELTVSTPSVCSILSHPHFPPETAVSVVANYPLNVTNNITAFALNQLGVSDVVKSIESDLSVQVNNCLTYSGYPSLMTFTHCPYKTTFNYDDCKNCKFKPGLDYTNERGHKFNIRRTKVSNCYFDLINDIKIENNNATMIDLRGNN